MRFNLATLVLLLCVLVPATAAEKPNIVLIMSDDVGYECFGCYGSTQYHTPNLDRMASRGIRFDHAYSQPLCTPSRVKLMTGLSNARNYSAFSVLNRDQRTFGHMLQEAGYKTMVAGKWQLLGAEQYDDRFRGKGTWPAEAGFDNYCLWQVDLKGIRYWRPLLNVDGINRQFGPERFGPEVVTDYILDFMEANRDRPFFAYYPMILVHSPFVPTPDSADRKSKDNQRNFEDMVAYMDKMVGRIVRKTQELEIDDQTLVLFTSDNGTHTSLTSTLRGRTIRGGKGSTTDAGNRVPFIGYWPGFIPAGQVSDDLIDFTDFLPSLLDLAGASIPQELDGRSFVPQLKGQAGNPREWLFTYYNPRPERTAPVRFARDQRWKLYGDGRFFDVPEDPLEEHPLMTADSAEAAAAKRKLEKALAQMPDEGKTLLQFVP
jgi:arylsulfatase A